ncbi:MAG: sodium:proton antiporter, partial [FCB group bacterium]|nr:sodium:proton antiporter [FCB group bacterium]
MHRLPLLFIFTIIFSLFIITVSASAQAHDAAGESENISSAPAHSEETSPHDTDSSSASGHDAVSEENDHHPSVEHAESSHDAHGTDHDIGAVLSLWSIIPFIGILLSIALFPLVATQFWHHHYPKVSLFWAVAFALPFIFFYKDVAVYHILHIYLIDYIPFIILLWGLFTVSGGILLRGSLKGTPIMNTFLILIGTALASWMGTTGAAMLLIRPLMRANA